MTAVAALLACLATTASAQDAIGGSNGTVAQLALELAQRVEHPESSVLGVAVVVPDAPRGVELAHDLAIALERALEERGLDDNADGRRESTGAGLASPHPRIVVWTGVHADPNALAVRAARRGQHRTIHVRISMRARMVVAELSVRETATPTSTAPRIRQSVTVERPLDAELGSFLGAPGALRRGALRASHVALPGASYLALTTADFDRDGTTELVLLARDRVDIVRLTRLRRGGLRASLLASAPLSALGRAPARPRRPIGTLVATGDAVIGRTSDHASAFSLRLAPGGAIAGPGSALVVEPETAVCETNAFPLGETTTCARPVSGRDYFHAELARAAGSAASPTTPRAALAGFYARDTRSLAQPAGPPLDAEALITPRGTLRIRVGERQRALPGVGAALAVADLDADGRLEILTSSANPAGEGDQLTLHSLRRTLSPLWQSAPMRGSVMVAASADLDRDGAEELLAIEEPAESSGSATLWVIR